MPKAKKKIPPLFLGIDLGIGTVCLVAALISAPRAGAQTEAEAEPCLKITL